MSHLDYGGIYFTLMYLFDSFHLVGICLYFKAVPNADDPSASWYAYTTKLFIQCPLPRLENQFLECIIVRINLDNE